MNQQSVQTIQMTTSQTPPQAKNPLLNASLGPITSNQQQQPKTINFVPNMIQGQPIVNVVTTNVPTSVFGQIQSSTSGGGIIVSSQPGTGIQQQVPNVINSQQPMTIAGQVISNAQIVNSQPSVVNQVIQQPRAVVSTPSGGGPQSVQNRQQNLNTIQKLESNLQEAKRLEAIYQQQETHVTQIVPQNHVQHHPQQGNIQVIRHTMNPNQLQQQRQFNQQRLAMQQQHQHQHQPQQIIINQPVRQMSVNVNPNNTQALRNILQQSQPNVITRTIGPQQTQPGSMGTVRHIRPMIQTQAIHTQQHLQQQQPQQTALLQQRPQQQQQQQFQKFL